MVYKYNTLVSINSTMHNCETINYNNCQTLVGKDEDIFQFPVAESHFLIRMKDYINKTDCEITKIETEFGVLS